MTPPAAPAVRPLGPPDRAWLARHLDASWGGPSQAYRGQLIDVRGLDGLVAVDEAGVPVGFLVHRRLDGPAAAPPAPPDGGVAAPGAAAAPDASGPGASHGVEIVVLEALRPGHGIGAALLAACVASAWAGGAAFVRASTTGENAVALRLYARHGFRVREVRPGAVDRARRTLKPTIPEVGFAGAPMRDEVDLVLTR